MTRPIRRPRYPELRARVRAYRRLMALFGLGWVVEHQRSLREALR